MRERLISGLVHGAFNIALTIVAFGAVVAVNCKPVLYLPM